MKHNFGKRLLAAVIAAACITGTTSAAVPYLINYARLIINDRNS